MSKEPEILKAIRFVCEEKGLSTDLVISTIESALAAAYRKDFGTPTQNIQVEFDRETGEYKVFDIKTVTPDFTEEEIEAQRTEMKEYREKAQEAKLAGEEIPVNPEDEGKIYFNAKQHLMISEAKEIKDDAELGEIIRSQLEVPSEFGRMAAQTAKQVITQKLREAERSTVFEEFKEKEGQVIIGTVQRREGKNVLVDLGKITALMPFDEQVRGENYISGKRFKFYIVSVEMGSKGPMIIVSRSHENIVSELFALEIPEINAGTIEIMSIAREAGQRTKVAVQALDDSIDPIGSCVGQRGTRIQTIINELGGEKIDVIEWKEDFHDFIAHALSPAKIISIELDEEKHGARVFVESDQLSLAIGRSGQNVRLASKLTGWAINIEGGDKTDNESADDEDAQENAKEEQNDIPQEQTGEPSESGESGVQEKEEDLHEETDEDITNEKEPEEKADSSEDSGGEKQKDNNDSSSEESK